MKSKDYYAVLGVASDANLDAIKKAYRILAKAHHPDMSKEPGAEGRFKEAAEAYACLKNSEKRAAYDLHQKMPQDEHFAPNSGWSDAYTQSINSLDEMDLADLLASLNPHSQGASSYSQKTQHSSPARGRDLKDSVQISLLDSITGCKLFFTLGDPKKPKNLEVTIPAGVREGQNIRLSGMGEVGSRGGSNGDMYLQVGFKSDPVFKPVGSDLYFNLALSPWEAVLGAEVEVPTLQDPVILTVPLGTCNAQKLRIKGRGLSLSEGKRGDLYAIVHIETPTKVSDEERLIYESLSRLSIFNPRQQQKRN